MEQLALIGPAVRRREKMSTQGQRANRTGSQAEADICSILRQRGFQVETQVILCKTIYGGNQKSDLFVRGIHAYPDGLVIESKWQASQGSADEKFPYLVLNLRQLPCPAIVIIDGGGAKSRAVTWLKKQADGIKFVNCFTFAEFLKWLNNL